MFILEKWTVGLCLRSDKFLKEIVYPPSTNQMRWENELEPVSKARSGNHSRDKVPFT